jgi:hypothetical protein
VSTSAQKTLIHKLIVSSQAEPAHHRPCAARVQADTLARVVHVAAGIRRAARAWAGLPAPPAPRGRPPERSSPLSSRSSTMHADVHAAASPAPAAAAPATPPPRTLPRPRRWRSRARSSALRPRTRSRFSRTGSLPAARSRPPSSACSSSSRRSRTRLCSRSRRRRPRASVAH